MGGTVVIIILLTIVVPVAIMITGLLASGLLGFILKKDVDAEFEGHELLELSQNS